MKVICGGALLIAASQASQEYCRALILSGGASNGAWEAGVLWGLANYGVETDFEYDVVTGVSAGALNTAGLAPWPKEQVKEQA